MNIILPKPTISQPNDGLTLNRSCCKSLKFLAMPGLARPVLVADQTMTYPADLTAGSIFSSNPKRVSLSGRGSVCDASNIGLQFKRAGAALDAYIGLAAGVDQTWLFAIDASSWVGSNPGFFRAGPSGNQFILFPSSGLWVRINGTDFTSSIARPSTSKIIVQVSIKSGVWLRAYVNGKQIFNQSITATNPDLTSTNGNNFFFRHSATEYIVGNAILCALWSEFINQDLTVNPWQIFAPDKTLYLNALTGGNTVNIGQTVETDLAQLITSSKLVTLNQNTETELSQTLTAAKSLSVGLQTETDSVFNVVVGKLLVLGQTNETDTAQPLGTGLSASINQTIEFDTNNPLSVLKSVSLNQPQETELAQSITISTGTSLGITIEVDFAQALAIAKAVQLNQTTSSDTAQVIASLKELGLAQVIETNSAFSVSVSKSKSVGQVTETELAQALSVPKFISLGIVTESNIALAVTVPSSLTLTQADIDAIVTAVWSHPNALTLAKFIALKDS